jgi:hypothetical protein
MDYLLLQIYKDTEDRKKTPLNPGQGKATSSVWLFPVIPNKDYLKRGQKLFVPNRLPFITYSSDANGLAMSSLHVTLSHTWK